MGRLLFFVGRSDAAGEHVAVVFSIGDGHRYTTKDVTRISNVSSSRADQVELRALRKMKQVQHRKVFRYTVISTARERLLGKAS